MKRWISAAGIAFFFLVIGAVIVTRRSETVVQAAGDHAAHVVTPSGDVADIARMAAEGNIHASHALDEMRWAATPRQAAPANAALPADDMGVVARLAQSPRKGEYIKVDVAGTPVNAWVVQPQGTGRAPVVLVIQEIFGLSDWIRGVADQLAAEGFIAIAPDLLSGKGPNGGGWDSFAANQLTQATMGLPLAEITARLKGVREWGLKQPRANGKSATVGFCFGGAQSFAFAANEPLLNAAVVFYGQAPSAGAASATAPFVPVAEALAAIKAPVLGLYGGLAQDARIGNTIAPTEAKMKELGKMYEPHIFEGAQHGFLRAQSAANGANLKASQEAWPLAVAWIKKYGL